MATGAWEGNIINDLFIGLYTKDSFGRPIEGSAIEYSKTDDGLKYIFTLREDHYWSDGVNVVADDFVEGFRRVLNPKTASQYASLLYIIKNAQEVNTRSLGIEKLGVRSIGKYELEIELKYPAPYLIELLTHYTTYPIPRHIVKKLWKGVDKTQKYRNKWPLHSDWMEGSR